MAISRKVLQHLAGGNLLHAGDLMTQAAFHRAYDAMPEDYHAELIGGMVFEPSPAGYPHGRFDSRLTYLLESYAIRTTGVFSASGASVILSSKDEVQPDVLLRIAPEYGGQSRNTKRKQNGIYYVKGAPELVAEVAHSSAAIDLHLKKERYAAAGVLEYIVICLEPSRMHWFNLQAGEELKAVKGVIKSKVFPGLWIDRPSLLDLDGKTSIAVLEEGMRTPEYSEFVSKLEGARK